MTTPYIDPASVHNPSPGTSPPASWGDTVRDDLQFLARPAGCVVVRAAAQSIPDDTNVNMQFTAPDLRDTDGFHDPVADGTAIIVPAGLGGWYACSAAVEWSASTVGRRQAILTVNAGVAIISRQAPVNAGASNQIVAGDLLLPAGAILRLMVAQTSGGTLSVIGRMSMRLVALS